VQRPPLTAGPPRRPHLYQ